LSDTELSELLNESPKPSKKTDVEPKTSKKTDVDPKTSKKAPKHQSKKSSIMELSVIAEEQDVVVNPKSSKKMETVANKHDSLTVAIEFPEFDSIFSMLDSTEASVRLEADSQEPHLVPQDRSFLIIY
jgi:hypothetical protein